MPHCYTALEELMYTFGGPWLFGFILLSLLILLGIVLSVARMKFVSGDELTGIVQATHGLQIDRSFPFLESLNEVLTGISCVIISISPSLENFISLVKGLKHTSKSVILVIVIVFYL